jgi:hypothetical protein
MNPPCKACPFRKDVRPYISAARGLALAMLTRRRDGKFWCHETVDYNYGPRSKKHMANATLCRGFAILRAQESGNRFVAADDLVYGSMGEMMMAYSEADR